MKFILQSCCFVLCAVFYGQDLLGPISIETLQEKPHSEWFVAEYDAYQPYSKTTTQLAPLLKDVAIVVFMGTWCSDSQLQVPAFYNILDAAGYTKKTTLIAVDTDKKTPSGSAKKHGITHVPTFIFYNAEGVDINRIVESPIEFLEDDMLQLLSGLDYKHTYED